MLKFRDRWKSYELLGVLGAFLLGLALRLLFARGSLVGGNVLFYGYDSFYHVRRIFYTAENFPHTLWFDSYLNHPWGFELLWPPLFDQVVAGAALLFGGEDKTIEMAAALAPPILGSASILAVYLLAKKLFGMRVAILSAIILAINPNHIARTHFGCADHDVLESLLIFSAMILLVYALADRDRRLWFGAAAGVLLAATAYTWLGAPIYMGAILIYATMQVSLDLRIGENSKETILPLAAAFGAALPLFLPFWDEAWLMPSFFGALGGLAALLFLYLLSRIFEAKSLPWLAFCPAVAISGYAIVVLSYAAGIAPEVHHLLWEGVRYLFLGGLAKESIVEAAPIYQYLDLVSISSLGFAFSILGLGAAARLTWRAGLPRGQVLFLVFAAFSLVLTISQARFLYQFSVGESVLISLLFFAIADRVRGSEQTGPWAERAASFAVLAILLFPSIAGLLVVAEDEPEVAGDWLETLDWIEKNTPATTGFDRPVMAGEYGVLSWWDYGNWILYQSRRPVVANNFQAGAADAAAFFLSENEEEALAIADARDARYVVTDHKMVYSKLPSIIGWKNEDPNSYIMISSDRDIVTFEHSKRFLGTVLAELHLLNCANLGHFRLVYESNTSAGLKYQTKEVKVFEQVEGAKISGTTPYEKPMGVILDMVSNQGRKFQYFNSVMPKNGRYEMTVPYSTDESLETHAIGPYIVGPVEESIGGDSRDVNVTEEDVRLGRIVEVNF